MLVINPFLTNGSELCTFIVVFVLVVLVITYRSILDRCDSKNSLFRGSVLKLP